MKTLIAVPCFSTVHTKFMCSLVALEKPENTSFTVVENTLIHIARGIIAGNAIEAGFDRVMFFDSDMTFKPDTLLKLSEDMDKGCDAVTGLYFTRKEQIKPVVYSELWWDRDENGVDVGAVNWYDYPKGLKECKGFGFGCCLVSVDLLKRVYEKFNTAFMPLQGFGEDLSFCWRAGQVGAKLYCDFDVKCGHVGNTEFNEDVYLSFPGVKA